MSRRARRALDEHRRHVRLLHRAVRKMTVLMREMVRCHLPASLSDPRQLALTRRPVCGALVFGHQLSEHLRDVHNLISAPAGAFQPVGTPPPEDDDDSE